MRPAFVSAVAAAGLALVMGASSPALAKGKHAHPAPTGKVLTVHIRQMKFVPAELEVHPGDTVEWKNEDLVPHSATAENKAFDTGLMQPEQSGKWVASRPGEIKYYCSNHPDMKATLTVAK